MAFLNLGVAQSPNAWTKTGLPLDHNLLTPHCQIDANMVRAAPLW